MAAVISASVLSTLLFLCVSPVFASVVQNIRAQPGENVFLPCSAQKNSEILGVKWTRRFQMDSQVVFVYRDGGSDLHPLYIDWVELKDKEMKDGDVSLILKNSETKDTGTYECHVIQRGTDQGNRTETTCIINLTVFRPGGGGHIGLTVGLSIVGVLLVVVVGGFVIYRKCKGPKNYNASYNPAVEQVTVHQ